MSTRPAKKPVISNEIPKRSWERVGCDMFEFDGKDYLICADYFSDFFEIDYTAELVKKS